MNDTAVARLTAMLQTDYDKLVTGERAFKIEGASIARRNVQQALDGTRAWTQVFTGPARAILQNQLASNQWMNRAMMSLLEQDKTLLTAMVSHLWDDDDLTTAAADLAQIIDDPRHADSLKPFRGAGARAGILSFFRLLHDPTRHPMYRPGHVRNGLTALGLAPIQGDDPATLLRSYERTLDHILTTFREAGLPLQDRLDAQAVLWAARKSVDQDQPQATDDTQALPIPSEAPVTASAEDVAAHLERLQVWLRSIGLYYPDALIATFLASLLTKPFVVLSGLSGTGKTRLALAVGERMGHVRVVPVKPDWTDTRGVLGYLNPLTQRYEVTETLDAVLQAHKTTANVMLVLDEMNLAHVERYFADVLSAMESGRPIPLHADADVEREQGVPRSLKWPKNLLVVGTVNADETTYPFSPKVLDRAFVIDVDHVDVAGYLASVRSTASSTPPQLPSFMPSRDWRSLHPSSDDLRFVRDLHALMREAGRPFGYRTIDESLAYLAHARAFLAHGLNPIDTLVTTKLIPRLHGRRHELEPVVDALARSLDIDLELDDGESSSKHRLTSAALRSMARRLEAEGYVASVVG